MSWMRGLRAMAHREAVPLPPECGALLDRLEGEIRGGKERHPRRKLGRRTLLLAAVLGLLACGICAAAGRMEWLAPVVDYGDSGALMEAYSVEVGQTAEGNHCDLTLETAITDGEVIYCLFTGRYDEDFLDVDTALEDTLLMAGNWANAVSCWRLDQGEEPGSSGSLPPPARSRRTTAPSRRASWAGRWRCGCRSWTIRPPA